MDEGTKKKQENIQRGTREILGVTVVVVLHVVHVDVCHLYMFNIYSLFYVSYTSRKLKNNWKKGNIKPGLTI